MPNKFTIKDIGETILAGLLSVGVHEGAHELKADELGENIDWDGLQWTIGNGSSVSLPPTRKLLSSTEGSNTTKTESPNTAKNENLGKIAGAGFSLQSLLSDAVPNENLGKKFKALSGLHLLGRAIEPRKPFETGDLDSIEKAYNKKTRRFMQGAMAIAGLEDLYKAKTGKSLLGKNSDLSFSTDSKTGTPMLMYKKRF